MGTVQSLELPAAVDVVVAAAAGAIVVVVAVKPQN